MGRTLRGSNATDFRTGSTRPQERDVELAEFKLGKDSKEYSSVVVTGGLPDVERGELEESRDMWSRES